MPTQRASIVNRIRKAVSSSSTPGAYNAAQGTGFWSDFLGTQRQTSTVKRSVPDFLNAYNVLPWLRAGGSKKAQSISGVDWLSLVEDPDTGQLTPISDLTNQKHPLEIFLEEPHPFFSWQTITYIWAIHLDLAGEAFGIWDMQPDVPQIWPITPDKITGLPSFPDKPYFTLSLSNGQHPIPYDQVFWMVDPNPAAPYARGSGLAQSLDTELNIDKKTSDTVDGFFDRQARPDILISGKGLNAEKTKKMESKWRNALGGFKNSFKPYFLSEDVDIKTFDQDFQGVQYLELRKMQRDTIIQVLGLPPEIMGILANSNRATIEAADLFFSKWTLKPRLDMMREAYQKQIVPKLDNTGLLQLDYVTPVQEDKEYQLNVMRSASFAFLIDEIRERAGEEPLQDGKGQCFAKAMNIEYTRLDDLPGDNETLNAPDQSEPSLASDEEKPESLLGPDAGEASARYRVIKTGRGRIVRVPR